MTKAQPYYHEGSEFIRISTLPIFQISEFLEWIPKSSIYSLIIENEKYSDCVTYSEYEFWHEIKQEENKISSDFSF